MQTDKDRVLELLRAGYDIHALDGQTRSASIGPFGGKLAFDVAILDDLYHDGDGCLTWYGAIGTADGFLSRFALKR